MSVDTQQCIVRMLDANINRLQEGIRVIEDIFRYVYNHREITYALKRMRHEAILQHQNLLLKSRDIENDVAKNSTKTETERTDLQAIVNANLHRICESARVLEECLKLKECHKYGQSQTFKNIRYEAYRIHVIAMQQFEDHKQ